MRNCSFWIAANGLQLAALGLVGGLWSLGPGEIGFARRRGRPPSHLIVLIGAACYLWRPGAP